MTATARLARLLPAEFTARRLKSYPVKLVRPVTEYEVAFASSFPLLGMPVQETVSV